ISVRPADRDKYKTLRDLKGHRVATLSGTIAYDRVLQAEKELGVILVSYDDDVHPYEDLKQGRVDAVLLDNIIAARALHRTGGIYIQTVPVASGHYVGVLAKENGALRDRINEILKARMKDGTLEAIYSKWNIWDEYQPKFFASVLGGQAPSPVATETATQGQARAPVLQYIPALLRASVITIVLSCAAMALAVLMG